MQDGGKITPKNRWPFPPVHGVRVYPTDSFPVAAFGWCHQISIYYQRLITHSGKNIHHGNFKVRAP